jgi:hypothetical protein
MKNFKKFIEQNIPTQTMSGVLPQYPSTTRGGGADTQAMYPQDRTPLPAWKGKPGRQTQSPGKSSNTNIMQREDSQTTATLRNMATSLASRDGSGANVGAPTNNQLRRPPTTPEKKAIDQETQNKLRKVIDVLSTNTGADTSNLPNS